jgi:hypothetical protein
MNEPVNCTNSELSTFLQGLAEGYLPTYSSDTTQCALSRSNPIASKCYQHGKKTVTFHGFPSLMMCKHSTEHHGEDLLTLSQEDSHARTSAQQEKAQDLMERDLDYGANLQESLARLDLNTSLWKTHQQSLFEDLTEFLVTFPDWGSMRNGELFPPKMSVALKNAKDFGRLRNSIQAQRQSAQMPDGIASGVPLKLCLDANATTESGGAMNATNGHIHFIMMNGTVAHSVAPTMWLTPQANEDAAGTPNGNMQKMLGNHPLIRGTTPEQWKSGTLNPTWIEWLMGFPLGWTDCDALAMPRFQQWQHSHGKS